MKAGSTHTSDRARMLWAFAITSIALFMTTLDNLVVTTALPVIRHDLHASLSGLEWMVNAYTLTFAVLLLTGAALGDRFGRRRLFAIGLAIFTGGSALAALAGSANELIAARAIQGLGGAIVLPLTLTILSAAVPPNRRGVALGAWGGIGGLAVALGPLVGGAIVQGISWQWIFWLNVPFGLVLIPLALQQAPGDARLERPARPARPRPLGRRPAGDRVGSRSRQRCRLDVGRGRLRSARRRGRPRTVRPLGAPRSGADAADALLPQPHLHRSQRRLAVHVRRDVRLDLPARPVLPDRAGRLAASVGPSHPALDGDADPDRPDRRAALRPDRRPPDHGHRPRAPGNRPRLDRSHPDDDAALLEHRHSLRALRHRDGDVLRARRQRRPLLGQARGRGSGIGRQQRDPRARRRVRRRGAGRGLLPLRRLPDPRQLRPGRHPGPLPRRRDRRDRRSGSPVHSAASQDLGRGTAGRAQRPRRRVGCRSQPASSSSA